MLYLSAAPLFDTAIEFVEDIALCLQVADFGFSRNVASTVWTSTFGTVSNFDLQTDPNI